MQKLPHLLTLTLRPHVNEMLTQLVERTRERMKAAGADDAKLAKLNASLLLRSLIRRSKPDMRALRFALGSSVDADGVETFVTRLKDGQAAHVQHRIRVSHDDLRTLRESRAACEVPGYTREVSNGAYVSALIVHSLFDGAELPINPDTQTPTTTIEETP